eukprot:SAG11_NODE_2160_length_3729_cov_23.704408_1_plen_204_part_00
MEPVGPSTCIFNTCIFKIGLIKCANNAGGGLFGDANVSRSGSLAEREVFLLHKLDGYLQWARSDSRVAGLILFHWLTPPWIANGTLVCHTRNPRTVVGCTLLTRWPTLRQALGIEAFPRSIEEHCCRDRAAAFRLASADINLLCVPRTTRHARHRGALARRAHLTTAVSPIKSCPKAQKLQKSHDSTTTKAKQSKNLTPDPKS